MSFSFLMSSHGILHQLSDAYTPQHNGLAKRKNRHLVETTRTLLLYYKVPHRFWADAILAACYLINCMSSLFYMIKSLIQSFFLINLPFALLLMSSVVFVLLIFSLLAKINSRPKPRSVSSWVILTFRGVINLLSRH